MSIGFIIGIVITLVISLLIALADEDCMKKRISLFFQCASVIGGFVLVFIIGVYLVDETFPTEQGQVIEDGYKIYGLEYKTEMSSYSQGNFVLGFGRYSSSSENKNYYYFFSESEYGKKLEKLDGSKYPIYIKETDDEEPNLKTIYKVYNWNDWRKALFGDNERKVIAGRILTVPTNTIQIEYNVDI